MSKVELHRGDCLDVMWQIPSGSVDAIIADLPYGTTACAWDSVIPFEPLWAHYKRIIKPRGAVVLFGSQPFTSLLVCSNLEWFKYEWVWEKEKPSNFLCAETMPLKYHDNIVIFGQGAVVYNPQKRQGVLNHSTGNGNRHKHELLKIEKSFLLTNDGMKYPKSIISFNRDTGLHPTQKPVALLEYLIKTYTNEGDTVMDNVMGSGTAGVACVRLNRNFIGIEKDADYFEVARKRIESEQENVESTLFYQAEKQQEPKPVQPTLFATA